MSLQPLPPDIADAIHRIDLTATDWPEELIADWKKVRGFCRSKHSESQAVLPASHAQAAIEAMSGVFGPRHREEEPDTAKHGKLPPDDENR